MTIRQAVMHFLILVILLSRMIEDTYADGMVVADFETKDHERITIIQKEKEYGLDLAVIKQGKEPGKKKASAVVRNSFGVVLDNPSTIFMCSIQNGTSFTESFQLLDMRTFQSRVLKVEPWPTSDTLECLIEENEKFFLLLDNFPGRITAYLFNSDGELLRKVKGGLATKIEIDGKMYHFVRGHEFGGFTAANKYIPLRKRLGSE